MRNLRQCKINPVFLLVSLKNYSCISLKTLKALIKSIHRLLHIEFCHGPSQLLLCSALALADVLPISIFLLVDSKQLKYIAYSTVISMLCLCIKKLWLDESA